MFCRKTGFKTKPHQRSNFFEKLIYLPSFMFLPKKMVLKLNIAIGIFFWGINYLPEFMFLPKNRFLKLNLFSGIIFLGD